MTKRQNDKKTKRQKGEKTETQNNKKTKRQRPKREFDIVTSGQFRTLAMFLIFPLQLRDGRTYGLTDVSSQPPF